MLVPTIRQTLCEVFGIVTVVFAPLEIVIFEDLMTLELLIDFLTLRDNAGDAETTGPVDVTGPARAARTMIVTSALALLWLVVWAAETRTMHEPAETACTSPAAVTEHVALLRDS
jgi:hypothetical protein